jgi:hypothetical protein
LKLQPPLERKTKPPQLAFLPNASAATSILGDLKQ